MPVEICADAKSFLTYKHRREDDVRRSCVIEKSSSGGTSGPYSSSARETPTMWVVAMVSALLMGAASEVGAEGRDDGGFIVRRPICARQLTNQFLRSNKWALLDVRYILACH